MYNVRVGSRMNKQPVFPLAAEAAGGLKERRLFGVACLLQVLRVAPPPVTCGVDTTAGAGDGATLSRHCE